MRVGVQVVGSAGPKAPAHGPLIKGVAMPRTQKNRSNGGRVRLRLPGRQFCATELAVTSAKETLGQRDVNRNGGVPLSVGNVTAV